MVKTLTRTLVALVVTLFSGVTVAEALTITPLDALTSGNQTSIPQILVAASADCGCAIDKSTELYKQNVGGGESGSLSRFYSTTFANTPTNPSAATISYTGMPGQWVASSAYLLVKDGHQTPAWYLFDLSALGWDGMATLDLSGFWPAQGAISHVALYGTAVPEPTTLSLLVTGLAGLALYRRRRAAA